MSEITAEESILARTIKRQEELIEKQEQTIQDLENKIDYFQNTERWEVCRDIDESKMVEDGYKGYDKLPLPRMEMRFYFDSKSNSDYGQYFWTYGLVYKHFTKDIYFKPMGFTKGSGSRKNQIKSKPEDMLPIRDGLHIKTEMNMLNLRGFLIIEPTKEIHEIKLNYPPLEEYKKEMVRL